MAVCLLPVNSFALMGIKEGDTPKEIILNDLDGKAVNVKDYFGHRPVILVFWELATEKSFLNYSLDELLYLNKIYDKYHEKTGLEIFGIYTPIDFTDIGNTEISDVRNMIVSNKIKFPILVDKGFIYFREYGVIALPSTIMIGKTGIIDFIYPSFPSSAPQVMSEKISELIGMVKQKKEHVTQKEIDSRSHRLHRYALQMYKKGLLEQAFSSLKKSIEANPDYALSHNLMGIILWRRADTQGATDEFKRAISLDKNILAYLNYTILLFEQGRYKEAEEFLKSAPSALGDYKVRSHYLLGLIYRNTNRIDQAVKEIELSQSLLEVRDSEQEEAHSFTFSFHIPLLRDLSELYDRKGNYKKAMEVLKQAVDLSISFGGTPDTDSLKRSGGMMLHE
jgi:tetratricopeptide (TPR) repeat protein